MIGNFKQLKRKEAVGVKENESLGKFGALNLKEVDVAEYKNKTRNGRRTPGKKYRIVLMLLVVVLVFQGCASVSRTHDNPDALLIAQLTRQADQWDKDIVSKNLPAIAANMADDFRQIQKNGTVVNKETFLKEITSPDLVIDPYTVEDFDVRVYGNVALLCGTTRMTGSYAGQVFRSHYRYIDIYVKREGKWSVCSVQISPIPD